MSKKLMLIAAAICGLSIVSVAQQNPAPAPAAGDKPAAEAKADKKAKKAPKAAKAAKPAKKGKKQAKADKPAEAAPAATK